MKVQSDVLAALVPLVLLVTAADSTVDDPISPSASPQAVACIGNGEGYLRTTLTGPMTRYIDWDDQGTACAGYASGDEVSLTFSRDIAGPGLEAGDSILNINIRIFDIRPGSVGGGHPGEIIISGPAAMNQHFVTPNRACTVRVDRSEPVDGDKSVYVVEGNGWCDQPAIGSLGQVQIQVNDFEFAGAVSVSSSGG